MFEYSDPVETGVLERTGALSDYRIMVHGNYRQFAILAQSAFTLLEAFEGLGEVASVDTIDWVAFPRTANASDRMIDDNRFTGGPSDFGFQDEYVEWTVDRDDAGRITRITFTTEFPEYYEALAGVSAAALVEGVRDAIPGADPTVEEFFGAGFAPDSATKTVRQRKFVEHLPENPWQNGTKGILCLQQRFNTLGALFNLAGQCAVRLPGSATAACSNAPNKACGPDRNSDPRVCSAAQEARRQNRVLSVADPAGIQIRRLGGIWKLDGQAIDIATREDLWRITHNGRRALLTVPDAHNLTMVDDPVTTGAQVARALRVGASIISADEAVVPAWARTGQESSRQIV